MKKSKTTTFLLELPLRVDAGQASRLHAHLEVARCFYNAMLGEAKKRLKRVRADPAWQKARVIARSQKQDRGKAFSLVRQRYGFSEFVAHLRRIVAKTGGTLSEVPTYHSKLSQYCHNCKSYVKKPLSQRWHRCPCGLGPVQRDLYSACLLAYLDPTESVPSITQEQWVGVESRLKAVVEVLHQRANEGQSLPRSFGIPGARARRPQSLVPNQQELASLSGRGRQEALGLVQEPPCL